MATILICDDDPDIRSAMRRTLRGHECIEAAEPREALELLKTREFDLLISDFSMGSDSDGLDLLIHVKLMYPNTVRFLCTANRDIEVAVRAINEGSVHRYILKPWDDAKLRMALDMVLAATHTAKR